ncbi:MAG TPA: RDD family protein [Candidatus Limnocylindrales bacterium]|nr:RDD family protein [Candidatus Limnocylindrales bacterium]
MTDPTGGAPQAPIPPQPVAPPPAAPAPPIVPAPVVPAPPAVPAPVVPAPPPAGGSWNAPPPTPAPGAFNPNFQQAAVAVGPAPGVVYADLVNRIIALVIDGVILFVVQIALGFVFAAIQFGVGFSLILSIVAGLIWAAISAVYYVYGWTKMRASFGQKFLNLETVNAADGATLTQNQAIRRWAFLFGPFALGAVIPIVGVLVSLLAIGYALYLLYTTSQSPKRQGFHDVQASTVVVKRLAA